METTGPAGSARFRLAAVNVQDPTAELRPPAVEQTDEADLMPYELLDAIERAAIRDKQSPWKSSNLMRAEFPQYSRQQLAWVERFFRLWCRNQWKRERTRLVPPGRRKPRPQNLVPLPDPLRRLFW